MKESLRSPQILASCVLLSTLVLVGCAPTLAQTAPSVAAPSGPVFEATSSNGNFAMRLTGCVRDTQKQVVCAVVVRSLAQTGLSISVDLFADRLVAPTGFAYPGYIVVEGAKQTGNQLVFNLGTGQTANQRLIFPNVPEAITFIPYLELAGYEFRGIPIGTAIAQTPATPAQPAPNPSSFEATLKNATLRLAGCAANQGKAVCDFTVVQSGPENISINIIRLRAFDPSGNVLTEIDRSIGGQYVGGLGFNLPAGVPVKGQIVVSTNSVPTALALLEFTLVVNDELQAFQWRNVPVSR